MFVYIIYRKKEKVNYFLFYFTSIFKKCFFLYNSLIQITDYLKKETSMDTPLRHQNLKKLKTLFLSTLYISAFTFGGGFVIVGFMRRKFVHDLHWIDEEEMLRSSGSVLSRSSSCKCRHFNRLENLRICRNAYCCSGNHSPSYDHSFSDLLVLFRLCLQPSDIRCPSRHGSRSCRHSSGCCLRPWHGNC